MPSVPTLTTAEQAKRDSGVVQISQAPITPQVTTPAQETQSNVPPEIAVLNSYMMDNYGVDFSTAMQYVQGAMPAAQQPPVEVSDPVLADIQALKSAWGVDDAGLDERMQVVAAELAKLPSNQQPMYDTVEGAQLLWQKSQMGNTPPPVERATIAGRTTANSSQYHFTRSQIFGMSEAELRSNDAAITFAEATGKIFEDA